FVTVGYGIVGFLDDYYKLTRSKKGLPGRIKLVASFAIAYLALAYLFMSSAYSDDIRFRLALPLVDFYRHPLVLGWGHWSSLLLYVTLGMFVVSGTSHAVNLTDGLDGLAIGPVIIAS